MLGNVVQFQASNYEIESMRFGTLAAGRVGLIYQWTRYNPQEMNRTVATRAAVCNHISGIWSCHHLDLGLESRRSSLKDVNSPQSIQYATIE